MPMIKEAELKRQLDKEELQSLYILYGEEKHLVKRAAKRLIKKAAGEAFPEFNLNEFGSTADIDSIADAAEALPLMSERKCVAVSDFNIEDKKAKDVGKLQQLLETVPETTTLVFYYPTVQMDLKRSAKWRNLIKLFDKHGCSVDFKLRETADLVKLLIRETEKANCVLSKQNAQRIVEYTGSGLKGLLNETAKLCAFAGTGEITRDMIEQMVPKNLETTVFVLSGALVGGDYEKAYQYMDMLFHAGEEPIAILSALSSAYVDMYRVKAALESGLRAVAPKDYGDYRGREFRLSKAERSVKGVPVGALHKSLAILMETDMALKGSRLDARIIMDALIAKLLLAAKGERV